MFQMLKLIELPLGRVVVGQEKYLERKNTWPTLVSKNQTIVNPLITQIEKCPQDPK